MPSHIAHYRSNLNFIWRLLLDDVGGRSQLQSLTLPRWGRPEPSWTSSPRTFRCWPGSRRSPWSPSGCPASTSQTPCTMRVADRTAGTSECWPEATPGSTAPSWLSALPPLGQSGSSANQYLSWDSGYCCPPSFPPEFESLRGLPPYQCLQSEPHVLSASFQPFLRLWLMASSFLSSLIYDPH